ncbi:hypothetical protein [Streptomyces europaeiscabiei]|uniref:hypothetical protein n=1 Tax=Streptomyces europaeiscabiei TaxID=146819 RepID=UPI0029A0A9F3|nr:hypothetical protein [Streptomyces europaeiscabiei]MDX2767010.1 hypothetical protein [Streptomyces europaeiscabiei]
MTYQEALTADDLLARFCHTQLDRLVPGSNPARTWANARRYGLTAAQLGRLCAQDPDTVRRHLTA